MFITPEESVNITAALSPGDMSGEPCDWWIGAFSPLGNYWVKGSVENNLVEFAPKFAVDLTTPQAWLSKTAGIASYFEANFTKIRCE